MELLSQQDALLNSLRNSWTTKLHCSPKALPIEMLLEKALKELEDSRRDCIEKWLIAELGACTAEDIGKHPVVLVIHLDKFPNGKMGERFSILNPLNSQITGIKGKQGSSCLSVWVESVDGLSVRIGSEVKHVS